jgi:hypothetical protein
MSPHNLFDVAAGDAVFSGVNFRNRADRPAERPFSAA